MKILFVIESPRIKYHYLTKLQPLGVLYIASYLESKNIDVDVLDFNVEKRRKFNPNNYDLIGYSVTSGNIELTLDSIKWAKSLNPKIKILIGGPMVSLSPKELILNKDVDVCVEGEAENTVYKYLISSDKSKIKGLWLKKNGKPYYTGKSKPIGNLDILPFPAIEKVPFKDYHVVFKKTKNVIALITSRGCPYTCIFCHHSLGFKFRARSPENVVMEIERNIKNFGINEFWIADDNFTMDIDRVEKICDLIISK
ncbi:radical SAM protein [archaeon]|nr:radical SAM protein [archaeon]